MVFFNTNFRTEPSGKDLEKQRQIDESVRKSQLAFMLANVGVPGQNKKPKLLRPDGEPRIILKKKPDFK